MKDLDDVCEERINGHWVRRAVAEVLTAAARSPIRCPECHGRVRAHKEGTTGQRAHFEHMKRHEGCSLKKSTFSGRRARHPEALE